MVLVLDVVRLDGLEKKHIHKKKKSKVYTQKRKRITLYPLITKKGISVNYQKRKSMWITKKRTFVKIAISIYVHQHIQDGSASLIWYIIFKAISTKKM